LIAKGEPLLISFCLKHIQVILELKSPILKGRIRNLDLVAHHTDVVRRRQAPAFPVH